MSIVGLDEDNVVDTYNGTLFGLKKELNPVIISVQTDHATTWMNCEGIMDKWKILYDCTYIRYLEQSTS